MNVLITGASSGIGAAAAALLAARGFRVFGASRNVDAARQRISRAEWLSMDVTDEASVDAGVKEVVARAGQVDALVCCAGFGIFGSIEETSVERTKAQFETNFFGTLIPIRVVLPAMRERRGGRILVVGSLSGRAPIPFQAHYSASKAAVDNLVLALRNEVHPYGIFATLIEPGDIRTEFNDRTDWGDVSSSAYAERIRSCEEVIRKSLPLAPGPEVVAATILAALTARRPRVRYTVGPDARLVPFARRLLPDAWSLAAIRRHFRV